MAQGAPNYSEGILWDISAKYNRAMLSVQVYTNYWDCSHLQGLWTIYNILQGMRSFMSSGAAIVPRPWNLAGYFKDCFQQTYFKKDKMKYPISLQFIIALLQNLSSIYNQIYKEKKNPITVAVASLFDVVNVWSLSD